MKLTNKFSSGEIQILRKWREEIGCISIFMLFHHFPFRHPPHIIPWWDSSLKYSYRLRMRIGICILQWMVGVLYLFSIFHRISFKWKPIPQYCTFFSASLCLSLVMLLWLFPSFHSCGTGRIYYILYNVLLYIPNSESPCCCFFSGTTWSYPPADSKAPHWC